MCVKLARGMEQARRGRVKIADEIKQLQRLATIYFAIKEDARIHYHVFLSMYYCNLDFRIQKGSPIRESPKYDSVTVLFGSATQNHVNLLIGQTMLIEAVDDVLTHPGEALSDGTPGQALP